MKICPKCKGTKGKVVMGESKTGKKTELPLVGVLSYWWEECSMCNGTGKVYENGKTEKS